MSDKSFGDHTNRSVVKNPLLSTSVVGLSVQDLSSSAVLLPVAQSPGLISSQDGQPHGTHHRSSGDANPKPHHAPQSSADDFDVSEYFARLQGTRYVSAPVNVDAELEKTALEKAEEDLEEINLNEQPVPQSLTSDIAQNFSQLPQVLPQVASAVFSSFSSMLSYKSRDLTPEIETKAEELREQFPALGVSRDQVEGPGLAVEPLGLELRTGPVAAPPKDVLGGTQNTFRITTKKKSYAQIPGLSSVETVPTNQYSKPPQATPISATSFEPGHLNMSTQITTQLSGLTLEQGPPPTSFGMQSFQSEYTPSGQAQEQSSQPGQLPICQPGPPQPPLISQFGLYNQGDRMVSSMTSQSQGDIVRSSQDSVTEKLLLPSGELDVGAFQTVKGGAENIALMSQDTVKETERQFVETSTAFKPPQATESVPRPVEHVHAFSLQNPSAVDPSQTIQMTIPMPPKACPQNSNSFSNLSGQGMPIIPPPTMFSNQRRDSKTDVGKTILPPSVARRLAGTQPLIKQPLNQTTFQANIFVPASLSDQTTEESPAAASNPTSFGHMPPAVSTPAIVGSSVSQQVPSFGLPAMSSTPTFQQNIPTNYATSSTVLPTPPPNFAAASNNSTQNATVMPPPPMFTNPMSSEPQRPNTVAMSNVFATPSSSNRGQPTPTLMNNPMANITTQPNQKMVQNILEPPKPLFDPIAFTTNPPEPPKVVPEPPKISSGNTNFRLSKKRPQYYSGPIEGVGSISNNVKPIIPQTEMPYQGNVYQGDVFAPEPLKPAEISTLNVGQSYIPPTLSLEASTVPFNLSNAAAQVESNVGYRIHDQQQHIVCDEINTAFDFSRQTTESFDQPKQDSIGFGLIGSLKSKLSALDINKIQNTVTTFFDPGYNDVKAEPDNRVQNYGQSSFASTSQNYGQSVQNYGQPNQGYGQQNQQTNLEIFIPNSQQMPEQMFNQQCYDSTFNQCQSSNMNVHGLHSNNQYFPEHYNYYQHPTQNPTDVQSYYSPHSTNTYVLLRSAQNQPTAEQIQENNTTNVYNSNVYNFNQMTEDVTSKGFFDGQHQKNVNQYGAGQADSQIVTHKPFQNQTIGYQECVPPSVSESHLSHSISVGENVPLNSQIENNDPIESHHMSPMYSRENISSNVANVLMDQNKDLSVCQDVSNHSLKPATASMDAKDEENESGDAPIDSEEDEPKINISKEHLIGLSSSLADNYKEVCEKLEDLTLEKPPALKPNDHNTYSFFDSIDRKEPNEPKSDEDITDLKMCETCREVNSGDSSKTDLTSQLIQNITAPIQLSNPVEVPLTEIDNPVLDSLQYVSSPCEEISHVTEETIEAIQMHLATELLDRKQIGKFEQRHEIPEVTSYGWCDQTETQDLVHDLTDPNIKNINEIYDYAFHTDPNAVGLISDNSLFFDDIPNNASDEIKAEFKNAHDEPIMLSRQMSVPSAPTEEDLINTGIDVQLIEQDAKRDFPVFEEFVIEPSTDDDKVKERERSGSEEEVNVTDSFTNRVERFKKLDDPVEPAAANVIFNVTTSTSPSMTIASYFDTGNYAADTHYRNSLTSPSSINTMNSGAQKHGISILTPAVSCSKDDKEDVPLFPDVDRSIYKVPDVGTQTTIVTTTKTANVCSYTTTTSAFTPTFCLPERSFIPQPSVKEILPSDAFATQALPRETVLGSKPASSVAEVSQEPPTGLQDVFQKNNVAPPLSDPKNFFAAEKPNKITEDAGSNRLASYFASPAKPADNTKSFFELSQGQDHLKDNMSKNWECTQSYKSFFESNIAEVDEANEDRSDASLRKQETATQERQSMGKEQVCPNLPQNWESTQSFRSYFDTDDDRNANKEEANKNKTLYEMTQSQNVTYTPEQYSANLPLIKDLTAASNFLPTEDQVVRTVNYNSVHYPNRSFKSDLSTGEPRPKNSDEKFPFNEKLDNLYVKNNVEEAAVPDDSKLEMLVHKCKLCCNLDSGRVVVLEDVNLVNAKVKKAMDGNTKGNQEANMSPEKSTEPIPNVSFPVQSQCTVKCEDGKEESNATLPDSRVTTEYAPVKHHWFYRVDAEGKSIWRGFSVVDNNALEAAFNSPELNESTVVPTDGGRFDVNVVGRLRVAVYWADKPTNVRRCSWFYKGTTDARYVPYTEAVAEKLEEEYRHGVSTGEWHRRLVLPNNEAVVMHGPAVMVHFLQSSAADAWSGGAFFQFGKCVYRNPPKIRVAKDQTEKIDHLLLLVHGAGEWKNQREKIQSTMRPRVVRRGYDESEIEDPEPSSIDHLLLLCHGVGSACDMRFRSVEEVVDDFRATSLQLIQGHYRSSYDEGVVGRVEVLPVSWHSTLHSGEGGVDRRLARITLESIPRLRSFTNDTVLDVLFYTSPVFCQTIIDEVCKELNRIYSLFKQRNPAFDGGVSLGGHSLGSVILYDLLCHQQPETPETPSTSNRAEKVVTGAAGTGQPTVRYPTLHFTPQALYALGSPIAIFECIRGVDCLGEQFALPNCKNFFNIFHPYDPIAYRELKETVARVGADLKQKLLESIKTTWSSMWRAPPPTPGELEKVVEEQLEKEGLTDEPVTRETEERPLDVDTKELLGQLNAGRRIDYVLQEAPFEMINEYLFAMSSHVCYWESEDTMLLMLREIYDALGVQPDGCLPQQTMAVQRTRPVGNHDDTTANSGMATTSGIHLEKS